MKNKDIILTIVGLAICFLILYLSPSFFIGMIFGYAICKLSLYKNLLNEKKNDKDILKDNAKEDVFNE